MDERGRPIPEPAETFPNDNEEVHLSTTTTATTTGPDSGDIGWSVVSDEPSAPVTVTADDQERPPHILNGTQFTTADEQERARPPHIQNGTQSESELTAAAPPSYMVRLKLCNSILMALHSKRCGVELQWLN